MGSSLIAFLFTIIINLQRGFNIRHVYYGILILILGFLCSIIDSILGEKIQVKYYSNKYKGELTEKPIEDGKKNKIASGYPIIDNNMVNFISLFFITSLTFIFF